MLWGGGWGSAGHQRLINMTRFEPVVRGNCMFMTGRQTIRHPEAVSQDVAVSLGCSNWNTPTWWIWSRCSAANGSFTWCSSTATTRSSTSWTAIPGGECGSGRRDKRAFKAAVLFRSVWRDAGWTSIADPRWRRLFRDVLGFTWKLLPEAANLPFPLILKLQLMKQDGRQQKTNKATQKHWNNPKKKQV